MINITTKNSYGSWLPSNRLSKELLPQRHLQYFIDPRSSSKWLREITNNQIEFRLVLAEWGHANLEECLMLNIIPNTLVWIREVEWVYQDTLWVYARVVIPETSLVKEAKKFTEIGSQSLGDILFTDPCLKRSPFEICRLTQNHPYYMYACKDINWFPKELWARRSIFHFHNQPLLINEIFTPAFFQFNPTTNHDF